MKETLITMLLFFPILMAASCVHTTSGPAKNDQGSVVENTDSIKDILIIKVGNREFTATLIDNPTATAFKGILPLTVNMTELNGNEKFFRLPKNLPTDESDPGTINSGDLMLWGSSTLVLFYKTFTTSYSYTKLGKITNAAELAGVLGNSDVKVIISLK